MSASLPAFAATESTIAPNELANTGIAAAPAVTAAISMVRPLATLIAATPIKAVAAPNISAAPENINIPGPPTEPTNAAAPPNTSSAAAKAPTPIIVVSNGIAEKVSRGGISIFSDAAIIIIDPENANIPSDNNAPRAITAVRPANAAPKDSSPWTTVSYGNEPRAATGITNMFMAAAIARIPPAPFMLPPNLDANVITPVSADTANIPCVTLAIGIAASISIGGIIIFIAAPIAISELTEPCLNLTPSNNFRAPANENRVAVTARTPCVACPKLRLPIFLRALEIENSDNDNMLSVDTELLSISLADRDFTINARAPMVATNASTAPARLAASIFSIILNATEIAISEVAIDISPPPPPMDNPFMALTAMDIIPRDDASAIKPLAIASYDIPSITLTAAVRIPSEIAMLSNEFLFALSVKLVIPSVKDLKNPFGPSLIPDKKSENALPMSLRTPTNPPAFCTSSASVPTSPRATTSAPVNVENTFSSTPPTADSVLPIVSKADPMNWIVNPIAVPIPVKTSTIPCPIEATPENIDCTTDMIPSPNDLKLLKADLNPSTTPLTILTSPSNAGLINETTAVPIPINESMSPSKLNPSNNLDSTLPI